MPIARPLAVLLAGCSTWLVPPAAAQTELTVETLDPTAHVIRGHPGGNVLLILGGGTALVVDAQSGSAAEGVLSRARGIAGDPVEWVINTHYHEDHIGGNSVFGEAGARILAHGNVRLRAVVDTTIAELDWHREAAEASDLPTDEVWADTVLHLGARTIELLAFTDAHTDGDLAVWLAEANLLHTGDLVEVEAFPFVDWWAGGSIDGLIAAVDRLLGLMNEATVVVPGHGHVVDRAHVVEYLEMLVAVRDGVKAAVRDGMSLEETMDLDLATPWAGPRGGEPAARRFVGILYLGFGDAGRR